MLQEIVVLFVGREYSLRNDKGSCFVPNDKGSLFVPQRWSRLCCLRQRLRQEQSLGMDHLLVVLPLLEDTPLPPVSQTTDFLAVFHLGHGCSDIPLRHVHLGLEQGHKEKGVPTDSMCKASLARAGHRNISPCWRGSEQFEIAVDLDSALDIHVCR
jgi:hypothetical protein